MRGTRTTVTLGAALLVAALAAAAVAAGSPAAPRHGEAGWRNDGTGRFPRAAPPLTWSPTANVVWKRRMGNWSNATPVLHRGRIFTLEETATVVCLDAARGEELWRAEVPLEEFQGAAPAADVEKKRALVARQQELQRASNDLNRKLRESPADAALKAENAALRAELQRVVAEVRALDQGLRRFGRPATHATNGYTSATPVAAGERLWVLFGTGVVAAFDLDGRRLWARVAGRPSNSWGHSASPLLVDGRLIVHIDRTVHALDPATGDELWTAASGSAWGTPFPVEVGGEWAVVTTGGHLVRCRDGRVVSGQIGPIPWTSPHAERGVVYVVDQGGASAWALPAKLEDAVTLARLWQRKVPADRYYASPLLHDGLLYAMTQSGHMTVLDAATGATVYERKLGLGATAYPSFCLAGGKVFASSESGTTVVFEPGREFREVARNSLEPFRGTLLFDGPRVYVRGLQHLWCLGAGS